MHTIALSYCITEYTCITCKACQDHMSPFNNAFMLHTAFADRDRRLKRFNSCIHISTVPLYSCTSMPGAQMSQLVLLPHKGRAALAFLGTQSSMRKKYLTSISQIQHMHTGVRQQNTLMAMKWASSLSWAAQTNSCSSRLPAAAAWSAACLAMFLARLEPPPLALVFPGTATTVSAGMHTEHVSAIHPVREDPTAGADALHTACSGCNNSTCTIFSRSAWFARECHPVRWRLLSGCSDEKVGPSAGPCTQAGVCRWPGLHPSPRSPSPGATQASNLIP